MAHEPRMKTAEQWHSEGGLNNDATEIQHRRQIQIDALRHAREAVEKAGDDDLGHAFVLDGFDKLIRDLELK